MRLRALIASLSVGGAAVVCLGGALLAQSVKQSDAEVARKSKGCVGCHAGIEDMHKSGAVPLGCVDCHLGNADATTAEEAHVKPKYPKEWKSSANPVRSYTLLNKEDPDFIQFVNPGDLRVADRACGPCHTSPGNDIVLKVKKSMMTTSSLLWGGASYNNGILPVKNYVLGESYSRDGVGQRVNAVPPPTDEEKARGALSVLFPLPRWEVTQPPDNFRSFERGGRIPRGNPSEIGIPNPEDEPGRPDNKLSDRGYGTDLLISSPVLNLHKTRLNDPHLSFLGTNDHPGDYRSSGCTACHVVYANDRSPVHSGPWARYGNRGRSFSADTTISKTESGHPIRHQFTRRIPSSQCMVCHMHQPNAFINTFYGFQMWDYESGGEAMYPKKQRYPSASEARRMLDDNPEEAVLRGKWSDPEFLANVSDLNAQNKTTQFADYHGHGWNFRAVFKKDRKGNLLDKDGNIIPWDDPDKFKGVVPVVDETYGDATGYTPPAGKAVHLRDIHGEKGMHCVDCHFSQDSHGDGNIYGEFHNAVEIQCVDCHGGLTETATLFTSGLPATDGGRSLRNDVRTESGRPRLLPRGDKIFQRSALVDTLRWEVVQTVRNSSPKARMAHLMMKGGSIWEEGMDVSQLAHSTDKMECQTCHTSWITNCFGCHLPQQANWKAEMNHYEGGESRNYTSYNPQVLRDDGFMICTTGSTKGNKITTARSSSALILSSRNANREQIYNQQAPISTPGFSSQAFNPHFAHTVRTTETRSCDDCHVSNENNNNAWMAQLFLQGTNLVNFMGKYVYVGVGEEGFEAVKVTEDDEPQAVIGSYLQKLAYPDYYREHQERKKKLTVAHHHGGKDIRSLQLRGEYLYTANGEEGFEVFDVANVDNKGFSEPLISSPVSKFGQNTRVATKFATAVALPTNMPIDTKRVVRPENQEQPWHPLYSYAYITDREEGLILVDVMTLVDRDPTNNFLERALTFNPGGLLDGAVNLTIAGNYVYICCDAGIVSISVDDPMEPRVVATIGDGIRNPKAVAVQFRYAFVCDADGVQSIDITDPEQPVLVPDNRVDMRDANDIYVARTYAYVAAGGQGLAIVDVERPDKMAIEQIFNAGGEIDDARGVKVASTNASVFAYVADGRHGLRVIQLTSPETPGYLGFSPVPKPALIATKKLLGISYAVSKGMDRDRGADESGNQVSIFGRLGSRPLTLEEQKAMYLKDGKLWTVSRDGKVAVK